MSERVLHLLCAGAAQALVGHLRAGFEAAHGVRVEARFGAVGAMQELLLGGAPCDVIVLSESLLRQRAADARVQPQSIAPLGLVYTGVAVRADAPQPAVATPAALRQALLASDALYVPDTQRSTAGQHVLRVLEGLGIDAAMAGRLNEHPNGATAMRTLAAQGTARSIGITQLSEIMATPGIAALGRLPEAHALATLYSAGCTTAGADPALAQAFVAELAGAQHAALRSRCGIEAAS